jgi:hypothetical protein
VLQFCPQAPVKSIEIALALSTLATVSLTEESFTRIRELAKWRSPEDRPSCFDPFQELPRLDIVLAFRRHEIQQPHGGTDIVPWLDGVARGTGAKPFVVPTDWQAKAVAMTHLRRVANLHPGIQPVKQPGLQVPCDPQPRVVKVVDDQISRAQIAVDDRGVIEIAGEDIARHVAEHDERSHAQGRVFKRGKLIGREISATSKFSSVSDKNRGGAAVMPCEQLP